MRYASLPLAALCLTALSSGVVHAQIVVDQSQLSDTVYMAEFAQTDLAQSFQQTHSNITGADVQLQAGVGDGNTGDITIALYNNLPSAGGTLLASGTDAGVSAGQFATVSFGQVSITPGSTYYLVFTSTNNSLGLGGDTSNPYPNGQVYANSGYGSFPTFDYTFQTFANATPTSTPEPGTYALLASSVLAGAAFLRRRPRIRKGL